MASVSGSEISDGPVLSLITKKLRALKKKQNRILQLEESQAQGKTLNKEQEDLLKSKLAVSVLIDEYEKLRQPLSSALQEELSRFSPPPPSSPQPKEAEEETNNTDSAVDTSSVDLEDLIKLLYFACLFDVKSQSDFTSTLLTRTHERGCCLTYDYVTDDATDLLGETDLDMISALGALLTSRPIYSGVSHKNALEGCIQRAKLWLQKSDEPILPGAPVTYSGLREKLNKIMALDYFTMTPEMKAPVDVAAAVGKYNSQMQAAEASSLPAHDDLQIDGAPAHYQHKEDNEEEFQAVEVSIDQSSHVDETEKDEASAQIPPGDSSTGQQDLERIETDLEHNERDSEHKEHQQYIPRRAYQNQRSGRGGGGAGGGRRGYSNGRGGRGGRGGVGGGYQNGRGQQYSDPGYYPRNYYNTRGRGGGRSGGSAMYNNSNHGAAAAAHGGQVDLRTNS